MRKLRRLSFLGLALLPDLMDAEVRIVVSDLLGKEIVSALEAFGQDDDRETAVAVTGSHVGWEALKSGRADIGLLSFSPEESIPTDPYHSIPIAYHTVMVLVADSTALGQVNFAQLSAVFGKEEGTGWRHWSDLGVVGETAPRSVIPYAMVGEGSLTLELFRHTVLGSSRLTAGLKITDTAAALESQMQSGDGGIALVARLPAPTRGLKALAVAREPGGVAFLPTAGAVHRGDYPISWPLYLVFRKDAVKQLYPLLRYILSAQTAQILDRAGLMPLPAAAREDELFGLERL